MHILMLCQITIIVNIAIFLYNFSASLSYEIFSLLANFFSVVLNTCLYLFHPLAMDIPVSNFNTYFAPMNYRD